jgi:hypothetical protein
MVTIEQPVRKGTTSWLLRFSSDLPNPTFYIYLNGIIVAQTQLTEFTVGVNLNENYVIEILDDSDAEPLQIFPGKVRLGWFFVSNTEYYRVDEYVGGVWTRRKKIRENDGYMQFESRFLEDGQTHLFRLVPVGTNGNDGTAREFSVLCVRYPDEPDVDYEYSNTTHYLSITEN